MSPTPSSLDSVELTMGQWLVRCSQRCSQRALVLKTTTPQVVDLRRHVELEGIEPSTSSMPLKSTALA